MRGEMKPPGGWAIAAKGLLILWLMVSLVQQYPGLLRRGWADVTHGLRPRHLSPGATHPPSELLECLDLLEKLDRDRQWRALLILPMPAQLEGNQGRFDQWDGASLGHLAQEVFQLAYQGYPRRVDVAFLNSRGTLLRVSYQPADRFVPSVPVDLARYEIVALPREMNLALDHMEAVEETSSGAIVLYKRIHPS